MYRKTYALVDCDKLKGNIKEITNKYDYKYYIGIVKANAYGYGDYTINSLIEGGVNYLAASSLEECLSIRKRNKKIPILCLQKIDVKYLDICEKQNITITITDYDYFKELDLNKKLKAHLKIDSGMNRLGFKNKNEVKEVYDSLKKSSILLEGIYTHFATSGIWDKHYDNAVDNFKEITSLIDLSKIPIVHLGRSLILVTHPKLEFANGIRLGIIMYGFSQSLPEPTGLKKIKREMYLKKHNISKSYLSNDLNLNEVLTLHSTVMCIKYVQKGEYIGYGAKYTANDNIKIAILPIGYADGINKNSEGLNVKINNKEYEIVGEIGMDMITIKIDDSVKINDDVIIIDDIKNTSRKLNTSAYCLTVSITNRVPRVYKENDKYTEIKY